MPVRQRQLARVQKINAPAITRMVLTVPVERHERLTIGWTRREGFRARRWRRRDDDGPPDIGVRKPRRPIPHPGRGRHARARRVTLDQHLLAASGVCVAPAR